MNREIWIHWGDKLYGPYRDAKHAREDGFCVPKEELAGLAPAREMLQDKRQESASFLVTGSAAHQ